MRRDEFDAFNEQMNTRGYDNNGDMKIEDDEIEVEVREDKEFETPMEEEGSHAIAQSFDVEIFPGGPMMSELDSWKKQYESTGLDVWIVDDLPTKTPIVYRTISRYEYKTIAAAPNTDPLMREEMICTECVLFPYNYAYGDMSNGKAGVVSIISQHILETSGFTRSSVPRKL